MSAAAGKMLWNIRGGWQRVPVTSRERGRLSTDFRRQQLATRRRRRIRRIAPLAATGCCLALGVGRVAPEESTGPAAAHPATGGSSTSDRWAPESSRRISWLRLHGDGCDAAPRNCKASPLDGAATTCVRHANDSLSRPISGDFQFQQKTLSVGWNFSFQVDAARWPTPIRSLSAEHGRTWFIYGLPGAQLDCPLADRDASNQNTKFIHFAGKWRPHPSDAGDAGDWTSAGHDPAAFFLTTLERNERIHQKCFLLLRRMSPILLLRLHRPRSDFSCQPTFINSHSSIFP